MPDTIENAILLSTVMLTETRDCNPEDAAFTETVNVVSQDHTKYGTLLTSTHYTSTFAAIDGFNIKSIPYFCAILIHNIDSLGERDIFRIAVSSLVSVNITMESSIVFSRYLASALFDYYS